MAVCVYFCIVYYFCLDWYFRVLAEAANRAKLLHESINGYIKDDRTFDIPWNLRYKYCLLKDWFGFIQRTELIHNCQWLCASAGPCSYIPPLNTQPEDQHKAKEALKKKVINYENLLLKEENDLKMIFEGILGLSPP